MTAGAALVWCPFPDVAEARSVSTSLLDEGLVACANIIPGMISLYRWNGENGEGQEVGVLFKTHQSRVAEMTARLAQLHSYQTPAIMQWDACAFPAATADWLEGLETGGLPGEQD